MKFHEVVCLCRRKGYPFEVAVAGTAKIRGVILADQVKSFDWQVRRAEKQGKVAKAVREEVVERRFCRDNVPGLPRRFLSGGS